jgi:hypothetical protein
MQRIIVFDETLGLRVSVLKIKTQGTNKSFGTTQEKNS